MTADPRDRNNDGRVDLGERLHAYIPHPHIAARRKAGPVKLADQRLGGAIVARFNWKIVRIISRFNTNMALWITRAVGTVWAFYVFNGIALVSLPAAIKTHDPQPIINWVSSNWLQLILLPAVLVGQALLGKAADARAEQVYQDAEAILHENLQIQQHLAAQDAALQAQDAVLADLITHVKGAIAPATERRQA